MFFYRDYVKRDRRIATKPVLVVPVRHGGELFHRCIASICKCGPVFQRVLVSVNGLSPEGDSEAASAIGRAGIAYEILCTNRDFSPAQHFYWLAQRLRMRFEPYQKILFLAHDDELIANALSTWAANLVYPDQGTTWIGDYEICEKNHVWQESAFSNVEPQATITPDQWLRDIAATERGYVFTNISGMCVPLKIFSDLTRFWRFTKGHKAVRCEYMLLTHRQVSGIRKSIDPIVRIHIHNTQEGRNVACEDYESDEIRYRVWLLINSSSLRSFIYRLSEPATLRSLWRHYRAYKRCRLAKDGT